MTVVQVVLQQEDEVAGPDLGGRVAGIRAESTADPVSVTRQAHVARGLVAQQPIVATRAVRVDRHSFLAVVHGVTHAAIPGAVPVEVRDERSVDVVAGKADVGGGRSRHQDAEPDEHE
jgi:hypothetical protein